jgi:phage N-6-adenine-methyltransferase
VSLVGFKAQNHPQQVDRRGARTVVDDRTTHPDDFAIWHERFRFTIDAAASAANARLPRFWTQDDDALNQSWAGERVWCNPPYSKIDDWVCKASAEWENHFLGDLIVMLLPANRTEQLWWQEHVEPYRDLPRGDLRVEFLKGRLRFIQPGKSDVGPNERPPFGCCLLVWGQT